MPHEAPYLSEWMAFFVANVLRPLVFVIGLLLTCVGLAQVYPPAAWVVPGALLVWLAIPPRPKGAK